MTGKRDIKALTPGEVHGICKNLLVYRDVCKYRIDAWVICLSTKSVAHQDRNLSQPNSFIKLARDCARASKRNTNVKVLMFSKKG